MDQISVPKWVRISLWSSLGVVLLYDLIFGSSIPWLLVLAGYYLVYKAGYFWGSGSFRFDRKVERKDDGKAKKQMSSFEVWTDDYAQKLLRLSSFFQTVPVLAESFFQMSATIEQARNEVEEMKPSNPGWEKDPHRANKRRIRNSFVIPEQRRRFCGEVFGMTYGTAKKTKTGETISGDHFSCIQISKQYVLFGICDGMGSGRKADQDSRRMLEAVEELVGAGFSLETALHMIHTMMLYEKEEDTTLVLDLGMIDLKTGEVHMVKAGAAASYLLHDSGVEIISCESLPIGIMPECDLGDHSISLHHGDRLVLVSDGVTEALNSISKEDTMAGFLAGLPMELSSEEHADRILEFALCNEEAKDDMLVLDLCIV